MQSRRCKQRGSESKHPFHRFQVSDQRTRPLRVDKRLSCSIYRPGQPAQCIAIGSGRYITIHSTNGWLAGTFQVMWKRPLRDVVVRCHVGNLRVSGVMARTVLTEMAQRWHLPLASAGTKLWGEYMAGTTMLSSFFKSEERVKVQVKTPDSIQELYVEAMANGEVRGKAVYKSDASRACGSSETGGVMHVSKVLYGATKPYDTSVEASGVPELDWQRFFDVSEQVPTIVRIDSEADHDHTRTCGLIVQQMPRSAAQERHYELEELALDKYPFVATELKKNADLLEYLNELVPGAGITDKQCKLVPLDYFCRCHFCNDVHHFSARELKNLIKSVS